MSSCTTIEIKEEDLFDVKRTINIQTFSDTPYEVEELKIHTPDSVALEAWYITNPGAEAAIPWLLRLFLNFEVDSALKGHSNLEQIKRVEVPLFIVAGREDNITPPELAQKLFDAAENNTNKEIMIIEKGDHNNLPEISSYNKALGNFYAKQCIENQSAAERR